MHDFPSPELWLPHRVSYGETDTMGFLYYAEYLHLFERARSAYIRQCGISYAEIEKKDVLLPVREASCRYRKPCRYDDLVLVRIAISELGRASLRFVYEIRGEDKAELHAEGMTQHACINRAGQPIRMPEWFRSLCANMRPLSDGTPVY
ncbi:MAG: acyl-CoA thioesterase [Desulfovibrio sp.]|nr:acyl-CoA thioesterase [Desulfovibrio sp.]